MHIRTAVREDKEAIRQLYQEVSKGGKGIARLEPEITEGYVGHFVDQALESGLILVAEHPETQGKLIGEVHAYKPGIEVFRHLLSNLTLVVHPDFQGKKYGRTLFTIFLEEIARNRPDVGKVELMVRESNTKAIALYQSLGFLIEGRSEMRIRTVEGCYEADIAMGWQNPNFEF